MPTISALQFGTKPNSASVVPQTLEVFGTNDFFKGEVIEFKDTATKDGLSFRFRVPDDYAGGPVFKPVWSTTATSGDVEWDIDYRAVGGDDTESLDQATAQESLNVNDTAPSAAHERMEASLSATAGNFAAGDTVQGILSRDGTDGGDTIAASVYLIDLEFEYTT